MGASFHRRKGSGLVAVYPCSKALSNLEHREVLRLDFNGLVGLGIASRVATIVPYSEATKATQLDAFTTDQRVPHRIKHEVDHLFCGPSGKVSFRCQQINEL